MWSATPGELIGAVDVSITGNQLHQRWTDFDFDFLTDPTPNGTNNGQGDSHLLAPAGSPFGAGPTETNSKTGSPLTSTPGSIEYGLGNLSGAWGILVPGQTANLAYLVFNSNDVSKLNISVKAAQAVTGAPILSPSGRTELNEPFPEPSTITLLVLAMVGGLGAFRRRADN